MSKVKTTIAIVLGIAVGALAMALILDNRAGAMVKAFNNPQAVNATNFDVEVIVKK